GIVRVEGRPPNPSNPPGAKIFLCRLTVTPNPPKKTQQKEQPHDLKKKQTPQKQPQKNFLY
ncbi:hypothetical protein, partial [Enterobacter sichuanensis]